MPDKLTVEQWLIENEYWLCGRGTTVSGAEVYKIVNSIMQENEELRIIGEGMVASLKRVNAENERLREALGNISRMRTLPDHASNTFTLAMAHKLADDVLACNKHLDIVFSCSICGKDIPDCEHAKLKPSKHILPEPQYPIPDDMWKDGCGETEAMRGMPPKT